MLGAELVGHKIWQQLNLNEILKDCGLDKDGKRGLYQLGHFIMAINIEAFTDLSTFKQSSGDILRSLRASEKAPDADRIYTAGEKEYLAWMERKDLGVPLNQVLPTEFLQMRDELRLKNFHFPFE